MFSNHALISFAAHPRTPHKTSRDSARIENFEIEYANGMGTLSLPANARSPWPRRILIAGLIWGHFILLFGYVSEPTPENLTYLFSITLSGIYTLLLYWTRRRWLRRLARHPLRNAMWVGIINAAVIEALFLAIQNALGAQGIAAHPNLWLDWILTMPWYIGMVVIFVRVQNHRRFIPAVVLLLGALYETGADGTVGGVIVPMILGEPVDLISHYLFIGALAFWQFIPVYSSMVLPPAWVVEQSLRPDEKAPGGAWFDALKPLFWLIPYTIYLVIALVILANLSPAS
jgi:hypothetical protein